MRLGEIDRNRKPIKPNLFLCRPDKKTIKKLSEAYDITYVTQLGVVNELTFKIPTIVEKDRIPIENPSIESIRHRYFFKLTFGSSVEYFIFNEDNRVFSDDEYVEYKGLSLGYELMDKSIRELEFVSKNLTEMLHDVLRFTNWKVGYVDSEFDLKFRSHSIASQNVLQVVYDLSQKFNAVILWDTVNREINFYRPDNVGLNKGFKLKYGKYLESFNHATNSEEAVTRLKIFGQNELTIRRLTPTGANYLEDFSWYMYPFMTDESGNVIESSHYMTDSLCLALTDYQILLASVQGQFDALVEQLTQKQDEIQKAYQERSVLATELIQVLDEIDVSNSQFKSGTPEHQTLLNRRDQKMNEIEGKDAEIRTLESQEIAIEGDIDSLRVQVNIENNLTSEQLLELNQFIIEKEYHNDAIVDDEDLLQDGIEAFRKFREPKINLNIDIVNFLSVVECQNDWDKLVLGDIVRVQHSRLGTDIRAKIIEINYSFEDDDISLVIANEQEMNQIDDFMKKLYDASNTSTVVNMDKYKWNLSLENNGMINEFINNKWDALKNAVVAGYDQQIQISERGIIVKSLDDPLSWLVIQNGFLAITNDEGASWKHAISKDGIFGERIFGKIISGVNLAIEDESGVWITRGSRTTIFNRSGEEVMKLGLVTDEPDQECFGVLLDNKKHRVQMTSCEGFMIEKWEQNQWQKKMYADLEGDFWVEHFTAKEITIIDNDGYFNFQGNKGVVSDGTEPVMWFGYIPPTDFGVQVKSGNKMIYMTRNRGFEINIDGQTKFNVDLDGNLYAQDVVAHNLKIVDGNLGEKIILDERDGITINGNNFEQIRLNANEGIAIDVGSEKKFWIGTDGLLYAKRLIIMDEYDEAFFDEVTGSYISDLTVNKVRTLNSDSPQDHVFIMDNFIKLMTGVGSNKDVTKFELKLEGSGIDGYPHSTWGAGDPNGNDKGYLFKTADEFTMEYLAADGQYRRVQLNDRTTDSILLETPHRIRVAGGRSIRLEVDGNNFIEISSTGVTVRGTRIDLN